jgi:hypothetical protein
MHYKERKFDVGGGGWCMYQANFLLRQFLTWRFPGLKQRLLAINVWYRFVNAHYDVIFWWETERQRTLWMSGNQWHYIFQGNWYKVLRYFEVPRRFSEIFGTFKAIMYTAVFCYERMHACHMLLNLRDVHIFSPEKSLRTKKKVTRVSEFKITFFPRCDAIHTVGVWRCFIRNDCLHYQGI